MRLASYVPGELIPLPLSGSIPELPHVAKPVIVTLVPPAVRPELGLTLVRLKNLAKVSLSLSLGANKGSRLTPPRLGISIA
jgi:hypothetical protein